MVSMYGAEHHIIPLSSMTADSRRNISTREKIPTGGKSAITIGGIMSSHKILYVFLICALLTGGAFVTFGYAQQPSSMESYQQELVRQLHTDSLGNHSESYKAYERMNQEMDSLVKQREEQRKIWMYILCFCAITPLLFIVYMVATYLKNRDYRPTWREVLIVAGYTIVTSAILYVVDVSFFYLRFYADHKTRMATLSLITLIGLGWVVYQLMKGKKK